MLHYEPYDKIFSCTRCDTDLKKVRGCRRDKRKPVVRFDCVCDADNKCDVCKGTRSFTIKYCPVKALKEYGMHEFIANFFVWKTSNGAVYPSMGGRLIQPVKLLEAFTVCKIVASRREETLFKKKVGGKE